MSGTPNKGLVCDYCWLPDAQCTFSCPLCKTGPCPVETVMRVCDRDCQKKMWKKHKDEVHYRPGTDRQQARKSESKSQFLSESEVGTVRGESVGTQVADARLIQLQILKTITERFTKEADEAQAEFDKWRASGDSKSGSTSSSACKPAASTIDFDAFYTQRYAEHKAQIAHLHTDPDAEGPQMLGKFTQAMDAAKNHNWSHELAVTVVRCVSREILEHEEAKLKRGGAGGSSPKGFKRLTKEEFLAPVTGQKAQLLRWFDTIAGEDERDFDLREYESKVQDTLSAGFRIGQPPQFHHLGRAWSKTTQVQVVDFVLQEHLQKRAQGRTRPAHLENGKIWFATYKEQMMSVLPQKMLNGTPPEPVEVPVHRSTRDGEDGIFLSKDMALSLGIMPADKQSTEKTKKQNRAPARKAQRNGAQTQASA